MIKANANTWKAGTILTCQRNEEGQVVAGGSAMKQQKNSGDFGLQVIDNLVNLSLGKSCSPDVVLTTGTLWGTSLPSPP